ncbi:hypothetical protein [Sphingomonas bacterium]|uniref:hypothetical protein n=1 Tax=Sphingomonas bacterium TaxID=1895847 RepID=UPI0015765A72|nr:hypothetical protein [Sphingomonas bacterium]
MQSPNWPFNGERPLFFVGQLGMGDLLHDNAQVFVFFDRDDGRLTSLIQRA